jgi:hypothetical protein
MRIRIRKTRFLKRFCYQKIIYSKSVVQKEKQKILPLTLDMMKVVNERFSLQADCGGIAGTCVQHGVDPDPRTRPRF